MKTFASRVQDNTKKLAVNTISSKNTTKTSSRFSDKSPTAILQRNLQTMSGNSPRMKSITQMQAIANNRVSQYKPIQKKENHTGLPDNLKIGIENLSGFSMNDVKVHYNSSKPAQLQAHAYAQGTDIHIASGQEKYLPHEAWHVVQQKQGRVKPTRQLKHKVTINDNVGLEKEADIMGEKAIRQYASFQLKNGAQRFSPKRNSRLSYTRRSVAQLSGRPQRSGVRAQYGDRSRYGRMRFSSAQVPSYIRGLGVLLRGQYSRHAGRSPGPLRNYVYIGTQRGRGIYVGITNNVPRRQRSHGARFHLHVLNRGYPLSRIEVRAVEQALINRGRGSLLNQNIAESISDAHPYYDLAIRFGDAFWDWARATNRDQIRFV